MADDKEDDKVDGDLVIEEPGKSKKLIIIIIVAVLVLLGGGGAGYYFLMGSDEEVASQVPLDGDSEVGGEAAVEDESQAKLGTALYVAMPRAFRFNIPGASRDRFVEIRVQLLVRGADNEEKAKMHIPSIESTLLNVFSLAKADDLATSAGKVALKQQSLVAVQQVMIDIEDSATVEQVLFTGFVMQ